MEGDRLGRVQIRCRLFVPALANCLYESVGDLNVRHERKLDRWKQ